MSRFELMQKRQKKELKDYWKRAMLLLLFLALFFKGKVIYVLLYTVALTYYLSGFLLRKGFEGLSARRHLESDHVFLGEEVLVQIELENTTNIPLVWVLCNDQTPHDVNVISKRRSVLSLGPKAKGLFTYKVQGRKRGVYKLGPVQVEAGDPFGIDTKRGIMDITHSLVVYPRIRSLQEFQLPSKLPFGEVKTAQRLFEDPARTIGARPYEPGDPYKRLHWKLTAKTGQLQVKEYQPSIALETMIFLNLDAEDYSVHLFDHYSELAVEVAASVGYHLLQQRQSVGMMTNGTDPFESEHTPSAEQPEIPIRSERVIHIPSRKGSEGLMRTLKLLACIQCKPGPGFVEMVGEGSRHLNWGSTLVLITPKDTEELINLIFVLRRSGYHIIVLVVAEEVQHKQFLHQSPEAGIQFYHIRSGGELEEVGIA
jgi:uncharacterized protein (DUF58 family)